MQEQKYQAVLAVLSDGRSVSEVAEQWGVSRQSVHAWLRRYEDEGLAGLAPRSRRPASCAHQLGGVVEARILELRRVHPGWGPRRILYDLQHDQTLAEELVPSRSGIYRALVRAGLLDPRARRRRGEHWRRWERAEPMELWQMDVVGGFELADGRRAKALTGVDDHSRFCVCAYLMVRETAPRVCDGLAAAMRTYGVPEEILTDNGKVFTGRFNHPPVEVLFDRVCRENGIIHRLTEPRSPTTTGKVERFHRTLRAEFRTDRIFPDLATAQAELDAWVCGYNTHRPHQGIGMIPPAERFQRRIEPLRMPTTLTGVLEDRTGDDWIARRAGSNGVISVSWQQICLGKAAAGHNVDVHVTTQLLHIWDGRQLLKTVPRTTHGDVRKKHASIPRNQD
ncbi:transposase InsO family protein [Kribbella pratensis]|uniref:Transposase InsO family protein n=1 Tax=Kribbella pratensis TaxID=2512112 RepID=A0A4R8C432_9ACTN|nr:transposase InsO family protein [Kribbella pratensis]